MNISITCDELMVGRMLNDFPFVVVVVVATAEPLISACNSFTRRMNQQQCGKDVKCVCVFHHPFSLLEA
ncbi:CLUMA_CG001062, isoform A [Clunio marinus]|uniref:CLUMA_CG001062, isoform A n=1 Tax=Clunio marinus TaxID=568069 RepID=A0A1J1HIN4_9DIPT|nr:CLUMA_CG001062, isoform A [Clunio marinus]